MKWRCGASGPRGMLLLHHPVCSIENNMRYSHSWLICCLLSIGLSPRFTQAETTNAVALAGGTNINLSGTTNLIRQKTLSAAETRAAKEKAKRESEEARQKAEGEEFQRQKDEKARVEAERQKELRRIELEVLKAAEARRQKAEPPASAQTTPPVPAPPPVTNPPAAPAPLA